MKPDGFLCQKSEMPQYLADKEPGVNISEDNKKPESEEQQQQQTPRTPSERQTSREKFQWNVLFHPIHEHFKLFIYAQLVNEKFEVFVSLYSGN